MTGKIIIPSKDNKPVGQVIIPSNSVKPVGKINIPNEKYKLIRILTATGVRIIFRDKHLNAEDKNGGS